MGGPAYRFPYDDLGYVISVPQFFYGFGSDMPKKGIPYRTPLFFVLVFFSILSDLRTSMSFF